MHAVFPIEAGRTESTEFREDRAPIRLEGGVTGTTGLEGTAARGSSANAPPPGLLAGGTRGQGWQPAAGAGWDGPTARTPIVSRANPDEPSTRSSVAPAATGHRALFLGFGAGLTVVALAFALAYFLGPRSRPEPVAPAPTPVLPTPAPVVVVQPPLPAVPTPPVVTEAPKPPVQEAVPPPTVTPPVEAKPAQKPDVRKKAPAHKAHATAKQAPASPVAPVTPVATPKETPAPKQAPTGAPGTLVLIVSPAGDVLIDGKLQRKQEGRAEYPLPPGTHQVEVRGPSNWRKEIAVEAGQKTWEWAYR
jgi:hypothetical protein